MISKTYYTYILTNKYNKVLYIGVTNNLKRRIYEHKKHYKDGFTQRYNVDKLIYYEMFNYPLDAIKREKSLKNLVRRKKIDLINNFNREWRDLYEDICN
jgi:putative endonuclease